MKIGISERLKKMTKVLIFFMALGPYALACDWSKVKKTGDGYLYPKDCHIKVGKLVEENTLRKTQVEEQRKVITLKDLQIDFTEKQRDVYKDVAEDNLDRLNKIDSMQSTNNWIHFGLGVLVTFGAILASKSIRK